MHERCNKIDKGFPVRGLILKTPVEGLACEVSSERGSIQKFESIRKYRTLLEAIQKSAELASKMLRQQHFLYQRKNLYTKNLYEVFQARQTQMIITGIPDGSFSFTYPTPYFIRGGGGAAWTETAFRGIINEGRRGTV